MIGVSLIRRDNLHHLAIAIAEAHKGSFTWPVIGHFLFPVTRDIEKLFPVIRDCRIPRYTWLQYIILRDTWSDVLFPVIVSHVLVNILNIPYGTTL